MTEINPDLAAVARALCCGYLPECFAKEHGERCLVLTEQDTDYIADARRAMAADPVRAAMIDFLIQWREMDGLMPAEYKRVDALLARAAAQVAP